MGYIQAYEFLLQKDSQFIERRKEEEESLENLRAKWKKITGDLTKDLKCFKDIELERLEKLHQETLEWKQQQEYQINELVENATSKIAENESIFKEKLRLEKPVAYWEQRENHFNHSGYLWLTSLVLSSIFIVKELTNILVNLPTFMNIGKTLDIATAKGMVITLTIISFAAFLVRTFSKLTFASFHLARDASERKQLTHVYLALKKEANIPSEHEAIILQSLFSRADTGLLGGDHSPTMPNIGNILDKK